MPSLNHQQTPCRTQKEWGHTDGDEDEQDIEPAAQNSSLEAAGISRSLADLLFGCEETRGHAPYHTDIRIGALSPTARGFARLAPRGRRGGPTGRGVDCDLTIGPLAGSDGCLLVDSRWDLGGARGVVSGKGRWRGGCNGMRVGVCGSGRHVVSRGASGWVELVGGEGNAAVSLVDGHLAELEGRVI